MKKTGFTGYVYDFSADYNTVTVDDIKDIHNYLMKKNDNMVLMQIFRLIKKVFFTRINNFIKLCKCVRLYINEKS